MTVDGDLTLERPWLVGDGEMRALIRTHDWSTTSLGPIEGWPQSLRTAVDICLDLPEPASVMWGPQRIQLYNDAYIAIARDRHPAILGRSAMENWPEAGELLRSILDRVFAGEGPVTSESHRLPMRRSDSRAEMRTFTYAFSAIRDEGRAIGGVFHRVTETTGRLLAEAALRASEDDAAVLRDDEERVRHIMTALSESEERSRSFAENSADVLWIVNAETMSVEYISPAFEQVWGEPRDGVMRDLGRWAELLHPDDRDAALAAMPRLLKGEILVSEYRIVRPNDGEVRWIRDKGFPILDKDGRVRRTGGIAQDITQQKQADEALRVSEALSRRLLASSEDCIKVLDLGGRLEFMSERGQRSLGIADFAPLVGTPWADLFRDEDRRLALDTTAGAAVGGSQRFEGATTTPDGEIRWWDSVVTPIPGPDGAPQKLLAVSRDVTGRRRAQAALSASEARLSAIFSQAATGLSEIGLDGRFIRVNDELCRMLDRSREELLSLAVKDVTHRDELGNSVAAFERVVAAGETASIDKRYIRPDGTAVWANSTLNRLDDERGRPRAVLAVTIDLSERKEAENSLRRSRRRLQSLVEGIPQLVWRARDVGDWTWSSPQWSAYTGLSDEESLGLGWLDALHPDDRGAAMVAWEEARERGAFSVDCRLRHATDGRYRWFQTRAAPVRDELGEVVEWLGTSTDVDELRRLQEHQKVLLAELQHRVRNTLAVVRSIARRTGLTSETVAEYTAHFDGRLNAFARTQAVVTRDPTSGVDLEFLVAEELLVYAAHEGEQVRILGPRVRLQAKAAESFSLAIHELATNAIKYGALAVPQGRITVTWHIAHGEARNAPHLWFEWAETGLPTPVPPPKRKGFGTELLERTLKFELGARTDLAFDPRGLRCMIDLPLTDRVAVRDFEAAVQR